jgi:hypothetical protein
VAKVRDQSRSGRSQNRDKVGKFGVVQRTSRRWNWMYVLLCLRVLLPSDRRRIADHVTGGHTIKLLLPWLALQLLGVVVSWHVQRAW